MKKIIAVVLAVALLSISLSGCDLVDNIIGKIFGGGGTGGSTTEVAGYERTDGIVDATTTSDGREVGGYQIAFLKDTVSTAWFDFQVTKVEFGDKFYNYTADAGETLVLATIKVKTTYSTDIEMYYNDFYFYWGFDNDDDSYGSEIAAFVDSEDIGNGYVVETGNTVTMQFLFQVEDSVYAPYIVEFYEVYSDGTEGNDFYVIFE